jgi:hypothetical protein
MSLCALTAPVFLFLDVRESLVFDVEVFDVEVLDDEGFDDEAAAGRLRVAGFLPSDLADVLVFLTVVLPAIPTPFGYRRATDKRRAPACATSRRR